MKELKNSKLLIYVYFTAFNIMNGQRLSLQYSNLAILVWIVTTQNIVSMAPFESINKDNVGK